MRIILGSQKATLGIRHLTEVVLDILGEVARRLDLVQWPEGALFRDLRISPIP